MSGQCSNCPACAEHVRFGHGLVIGKFYPPHAGHDFLIDAAAARCDRVTVVVGGHPSENRTADERATWLAAAHADQPHVRVVGEVDSNPNDFDDPTVWTRPWTYSMPLTKVDQTQQMFEYACHEGNHAMRNILSAARTAEQNSSKR